MTDKTPAERTLQLIAAGWEVIESDGEHMTIQAPEGWDEPGETELVIDTAMIAAAPKPPLEGGTQDLLAALKKVLPISTHNTPDYAELTFGDHQTQAMTMAPDDWNAIQAAYDKATAGAYSPGAESWHEQLRRLVTERDYAGALALLRHPPPPAQPEGEA